MLFLIYISAGLFLGWSLGSNDAANIFGTAVGSRMIKFRHAALIASIFVIIGAVFQGKGGAETLNALGSVDALAGGFTITFCAAFTVFLMTKRGLPVSTSQAIVGAIMGWIYFTGNPADYKVLFKIVSTWISGPLLGMAFSAGMYLLMKRILQRTRIHVIKLDTWIRISLIVAGAFGAYSLGANNIANVMGVFISSAPQIELDFGLFVLDGVQILFLMGGLAIALGIYTYSEKVMKTVGNGILALSPEAAIVVVLSQALVLFLFSSASLANFMNSIGLPSLPMVPVSSTQVVVGSVLGIGLVKGTREIKARTLAGIAIGWITTPIAAGVLTFFMLFFVKNVFDLKITTETINTVQDTAQSGFSEQMERINMILPGLIIALSLAVVALIMAVYRQQKLRLKTENELLTQQNQLYHAQRTVNQLEMSNMQSVNAILSTKLEARRKEFIDLAFNLTEQRIFLEELNEKLDGIKMNCSAPDIKAQLNSTQTLIHQKLTFSREKETFYGEVEQIHKEFNLRLDTNYPELTDQEKKLATLIRMNLSTKEIATLLSISPKSVEVARYRLKKKMSLDKDDNLTQFIRNI